MTADVASRVTLERLKHRPLFEEAIGQYKVVSGNLSAVRKAFPFDLQDKKGMDERVKDASRRRKAIEALTAARDAERAGLKALGRIAE